MNSGGIHSEFHILVVYIGQKALAKTSLSKDSELMA